MCSCTSWSSASASSCEMRLTSLDASMASRTAFTSPPSRLKGTFMHTYTCVYVYIYIYIERETYIHVYIYIYIHTYYHY